jgi:hypothetical protein
MQFDHNMRPKVGIELFYLKLDNIIEYCMAAKGSNEVIRAG